MCVVLIHRVAKLCLEFFLLYNTVTVSLGEISVMLAVLFKVAVAHEECDRLVRVCSYL